MSRSRRLAIRAALVLCTLALGGAARAEGPDAEKRAAAQALFDVARQLTGQDKWGEACPKLLESYRLDPAIGTKFYLAECYEHTGKLASAWSFYLEVVDDAQKDGSKDREKFATTRADALKPRLPRLVVTRSPAARAVPGLVVERDGVPVGEGMFDTPVPVDLGEHVVRARAPGRRPVEIRVEAKQESASVSAEIPPLASIPAPPPDPGPKPPVVEPPKPVSHTLRNAGFLVGGVGVVSLGAGLGLGGLALSKKNASNAPGDCGAGDVCTSQGQALRTSAIQAATISTALVVAGGAATVTGVVLLAIAPRAPKADDKPAPEISLGPLGASMRIRF